MEYKITSATLKKFRGKARHGLSALSWAEVQAYGEAVEKAVLAAQRAHLRTASEAGHRCPCASGTWHSEGEDIAKAVRAQQRAALNRAAERDRTKRTDREIIEAYEQAMKAPYAEAA
jgi:phosphoserine phosphatase